MSIRSVLFDLDGTLADTAPDLAWALNQLLAEEGRAPLPFEAIRPVVSHGGLALTHLGFGIGPDHPEFARLRQRLLDIYRDNLTRNTRLFTGMDELLRQFAERRIRWGVVTNKPAWLTDPLMEQLGLTAHAACIVSGDTTPNKKPHPEPLHHASRIIGCEAAQCLYVGDAQRDIEAGRQAGMKTVIALFGYLGPEDHPEQWGADHMVNEPLEILTWMDRQP